MKIGKGESDDEVERPVEAGGHAHPCTSEPERIDLTGERMYSFSNRCGLLLPLDCRPRVQGLHRLETISGT